MAWALEPGAVATCNNRQWQLHQSWWTRLRPSLIAMDAINAIVVRRQSAHKMNPSNATKKAVATSLKAARQPCQGMWPRRCEGIVSITTILLPWQWLWPQGRQLPQRVRDECKLLCFANHCRSHRSYAWHNNGYRRHHHGRCKQRKLCNGSSRSNKQAQQQVESPKHEDKGFEPCHLHGKHTNHSLRYSAQPVKHANNNNKHKQQQKRGKNKAIMIHMPHITCAMIAGQAASWVAWQSQWHHPQWQKTSPSNDNKKYYHFCSNPKKKRMLVVLCSSLAKATSSRV